MLQAGKIPIPPSLRGTKQSQTVQTGFAKLLCREGIASFLAMTGLLLMYVYKKSPVILNVVKDLFADFTGRRSMADNRSFTTFRMTNLSKRYFAFGVHRISPLSITTCLFISKQLFKPVFVLTATLTLLLNYDVSAQQADHLPYVKPFIGTAKSDVFTKWGSEGGTYPGAVAPSGFIQLSPETRVAKGYNYNDSSIYYFSGFRHMSGFPEGSAGRFYVMPVGKGSPFEAGKYSRKFSHANEKATPGYYKVIFDDDRTIAEATTTARTGIFKFTFTADNIPQLFIADAGEISVISSKTLHAANGNTVINFSENSTSKKQVEGGCLFTFASTAKHNKVIEVRLSTSSVSYAGAQNNIDKEIGTLTFNQVRQQTRDKWLKKLAVVDVTDSNEQHKTVFYTALYHSLLIPWVIDDVDGRYKGYDGKIHQKTGADQYGAFSPWDTFRSLHPLLTLLYPDKQKDVVLSMLDIYKQTGHLPTESMTGNHAIPIIVDTYLKGINGFDKQLAYTAMKKSIVEPPFIQPDMEIYQQNGYIPFTRSESVTRTVEYAYDDWALSQFAKNIIHSDKDYQLLLNRSYNYRNLLNNDELLLLPRNNHEFKLQPGMSGYKEGDKWVYSYYVPHNAKDLINLTGGNEQFTSRLDSALTNNVIPFDNETVFHLPYLFNQASKPVLTQRWVRHIMLNRYSAKPGGLPGNDDLGSTSSWYIFSAMGIYPACPGRPFYAIGAPLFQSVTLHLSNGKIFTINSANAALNNNYVQSLKVNGNAWQQLTIPHSVLTEGGSMTFDMGSRESTWPVNKDQAMLSETKQNPDFKILNYTVSKNSVEPNEPVTIHFSIANIGSTGVKIVKLFVNEKPYGYKNCLVVSGGVKNDSLICRLYPEGRTELKLQGMAPVTVNVKLPTTPSAHPFKITDLAAKPMVKLNQVQQVTYIIQNIDGLNRTFNIPVMMNETLLFTDTITLAAGERKSVAHTLPCNVKGFKHIRIDDARVDYKVYHDNKESLLLDLSAIGYGADKQVKDNSGYHNNGHIMLTNNFVEDKKAAKLGFEENVFVEVPNSASLDNMGETITMMGWIYPTGNENGLVDMITKGDSHVLQVTDHKTLTFFAGGWGRGDCTVTLPANWKNNWHHIAGVCTGKTLYLYIDGALAGKTIVENDADLSNGNKWTLGRNEEFPAERIFHGYLDKVKVFKEPLTPEEISAIVNSERGSFK
jgi:putative alpha-1,2-mannosidase